MDYGIIIPFAAFIFAMQLAVRLNAHPLVCASIAVVVPYFVGLIVRYILESGGDSFSPINLFSISSLISVLIQFIVGVYIFKKIRDEDNLVSLTLWSIGGLIILPIIIPYVVGFIRF